MLIMIDEAIPAAPGLFAQFGEVRTFDGRSLQAADLADADALIVRSVTRVDAALLAGSPVRFVGTATSGTDHVDEVWLAGHGIHFAAAPGCNARPVAEYVLTAILRLAHHRRFDPLAKTLGVVGVGHTGSLVARWARALGMEVLLCDPPLRDAAVPPAHQWLSPSQLLARADIVTLHVPLTDAGPYATREMVNADWLAAMRPGAMLINTARGEVVVESAVIEARRGDRLSGLVIDVWASEPAISEALVEACDIATPHVAGYSIEAKRRAASAIFDALAAWTGTPPPPASRAVPGPGGGCPILSERKGGESPRAKDGAPLQVSDLSALLAPLETACPLSNIDARLRSAMAEGPFPSAGQCVGSAVRTDEVSEALISEKVRTADPTLAERFDALRAAVSHRREFSDYRLNPVQFSPAAAEFLREVGFAFDSP